MFSFLYELSCRLIRFSGLASIDRLLFSRKMVTIVMYHNPTPFVFERHMQYAVRNYQLISMHELLDLMRTGDFSNVKKSALLVTFDDGWKENFHLLPIFIKYGIRPVIFLVSGIINTDRHFWWTHCEPEEIPHFKRLANLKRKETLYHKYKYHHIVEYPGQRQALNREEIHEMHPYVDFGYHSHFHPVLTSCSKEEKRSEILEGKRIIEHLLGKKVSAFSYPNGNFDDECIELLKEAGFELARTTDAGKNHSKTNAFRLKVAGVSDKGSVTKFAAELTGIPMFMQYFLYHGSIDGRKRGV